MSKIRCVRCPVGEPAEIVEIENDLASIKMEVGSYIETFLIEDDIAIVCNEAAYIRNLPINRGVTWNRRDVESIYGDFLICKVKDEEFISMDMLEAMELSLRFYYPLHITEVAK